MDVCVREERNIMYPGNQKINVMPALIGVRTFIEPYIYAKAEVQYEATLLALAELCIL